MKEVGEALRLAGILIMAIGVICLLGVVLTTKGHTAIASVFIAFSLVGVVSMFIVGVVVHYNQKYG